MGQICFKPVQQILSGQTFESSSQSLEIWRPHVSYQVYYKTVSARLKLLNMYEVILATAFLRGPREAMS